MRILFLTIPVGIFIITFIYTYGVSRMKQNKWIIFLPSELALLGFAWYAQKYLALPLENMGV